MDSFHYYTYVKLIVIVTVQQPWDKNNSTVYLLQHIDILAVCRKSVMSKITAVFIDFLFCLMKHLIFFVFSAFDSVFPSILNGKNKFRNQIILIYTFKHNNNKLNNNTC